MGRAGGGGGGKEQLFLACRGHCCIIYQNDLQYLVPGQKRTKQKTKIGQSP